MNFKPLHDKILIKRIEKESKTKGGIILPDTLEEKPSEGKVIAIGPGLRDDNGVIHSLNVKIGDKVIFGKWSGTEIKLNNIKYLIMKESDILGIIE